MGFFLFFGMGLPEMIVIGMLGLLLFGRRLPEVGRSLGKTFFELKRGMNDVRREVDEIDRLTEAEARRERRRKVAEDEVVKDAVVAEKPDLRQPFEDEPAPRAPTDEGR